MRFDIKKNGIDVTRVSVATAPVIVAAVDVCDMMSSTEYTFVPHRNQLAVTMRVPKSIYVPEKTAREAVNKHRARTNKVVHDMILDVQPELYWLRPVFLTWLSESRHGFDTVIVEAVEGKEIIHRVNIDGAHEFLVPMGYMDAPQDLYHHLWQLETGAL